jgi:GNAT superfamily N-acetyltransferase
MSAETEASNYIAEENLRDGRPVTIRALHPEDKPLWKDIWQHMSPTSVYYRFFTPKKAISEQEVAYFTELDFVTHVGLIALVHNPYMPNPDPAAAARYHVSEKRTDSAEIAFGVEDIYHGLGLGTLLLKHLAIIAKKAGIKQFKAYVLAENSKMLEVFENCGLPMKKSISDFTMWEVTLDLNQSAETDQSST